MEQKKEPIILEQINNIKSLYEENSDKLFKELENLTNTIKGNDDILTILKEDSNDDRKDVINAIDQFAEQVYRKNTENGELSIENTETRNLEELFINLNEKIEDYCNKKVFREVLDKLNLDELDKIYKTLEVNHPFGSKDYIDFNNFQIDKKDKIDYILFLNELDNMIKRKNKEEKDENINVNESSINIDSNQDVIKIDSESTRNSNVTEITKEEYQRPCLELEEIIGESKETSNNLKENNKELNEALLEIDKIIEKIETPSKESSNISSDTSTYDILSDLEKLINSDKNKSSLKDIKEDEDFGKNYEKLMKYFENQPSSNDIEKDKAISDLDLIIENHRKKSFDSVKEITSSDKGSDTKEEVLTSEKNKEDDGDSVIEKHKTFFEFEGKQDNTPNTPKSEIISFKLDRTDNSTTEVVNTVVSNFGLVTELTDNRNFRKSSDDSDTSLSQTQNLVNSQNSNNMKEDNRAIENNNNRKAVKNVNNQFGVSTTNTYKKQKKNSFFHFKNPFKKKRVSQNVLAGNGSNNVNTTCSSYKEDGFVSRLLKRRLFGSKNNSGITMN